ncbi:peptide deformylase [Ochrobactrum pseudogrignonense]|nr:peptide deformylase [Brucella pseudogrignonensis]
MTVREIVKFPDAALRAAAAPVTVFDNDLRLLAQDLLDTLRAAPGIGITAPHIGVLTRVVVLELSGPGSAKTYINPEITGLPMRKSVIRKGASPYRVVDDVERHARIHLHYQDIDGKELTEESDGLLSVCHQHEIDQLDGIFWLQRLSKLKRDRLIKRYQKLLK